MSMFFSKQHHVSMFWSKQHHVSSRQPRVSVPCRYIKYMTTRHRKRRESHEVLVLNYELPMKSNRFDCFHVHVVTIHRVTTCAHSQRQMQSCNPCIKIFSPFPSAQQ
mmetsp:Transcript_17773/g.55677  ORF Transcript_17773/g.55677 Transcript_17773/m.55677 type:complete len:107 (+) Transcript_17773:580-900(+)